MVFARIERFFKQRRPATAPSEPVATVPSPTPAPDPALLLQQALEQSDPARRHAALCQLATDADDPGVRHAAIARLEDPAVLADRALRDARALNRALAVGRLEDRAALEQVAREIGKRDKQVLRVAREKLRLLQEREELPRRVRAQCEDLCEKVERLGRIGNWSQERALLEHLDRQWAALEAPPEADPLARWEAARARFLAGWETWRGTQARERADQEAQAALRARREALLDELAAAAACADAAESTGPHARIAADWAALAPLPAAIQRDLDARYARLMRAADTARQAVSNQQCDIKRDIKRDISRLRRLIEQAGRLLAESRPLDDPRATALLRDGRALASALSDAPEVGEFLTLAERLETRLKQQRRHAEQRLRQLPERLAELEARLADGELRKADPLHQSIQAGLELVHASGVPKSATAPIAARLHELAPRLRELQHWRRWGVDQHRAGLCADMESLCEQDLPLAALAEQLHRLRADWKGLDHSGAPANQALWERFHAAAERVHARCQPFLEAQASAREASRAAREQVCRELETFLEQVDWTRVDWKKALRAEREIRQTWAATGPTDAHPAGGRRPPLERRFHHLLRQLDRHLDGERKRNQAFRASLIARVEALIEHPDLDAAIEHTKALQRDWHTTVPGRHKDENRLWLRFRAACDAVFERRSARHQAQAGELHAHLARRETLCAEAETLAAAESDPRRLAAALRDLDARWQAALELPVPRQSAAAIGQRWQACRERLEQSRRTGEIRRRRAWLERLQQQHAFCEYLERQALGGGVAPDPEAADPRQRWAALTGATEDGADGAPSPLEARCAAALAALADPAARDALRASLETQGRQRERLCLQLEILAGIESPPECAQQRLEIQVARLAEHMAEGEADPLRDAEHLLNDWYRCGPAPRDARLEARFIQARDVLIPPAGPSP